MTKPFDKNVNVNDFSKGSKLFKAYVDALAYLADEDDSQTMEPKAKKPKHISFLFKRLLPRRKMNPVLGDELVDKVQPMPDDIWIIIFKYFANEPILFNLYNVSSQLTRVMDYYFCKTVIFDVNKYVKLNKKIKIDEQVNYVMDHCNRTVSGIIIRDYYPIFKNEIDEIAPAIPNILDAVPLQLKLFHYDEQAPTTDGRGIRMKYIRDVMSRAVNLVDVSIKYHRKKTIGCIHLTSLVNLHSLGISNGYFARRGCYPLHLPVASLASLKLCRCDIAAVDLTNILTASRNTLVSLNLQDLSIHQENITRDTITSFVFPNLKCISVKYIKIRGVIDLKESSFLESIYVWPTPCGINLNYLNVVGLDFRVHRFIKYVKSAFETINFESFSMPDACLDNLKSVEFEPGTDLASIIAVLNRLAFGCGELEYIGLYRYMNGSMVTEFLTSIPKVIANNKKLRKFGFWYVPELMQSIIQSIIDTEDEHLECIEIEYPNFNGNDLMKKLVELGYQRSKKLKVEIMNNKVHKDMSTKFLSLFNIDFVGI